MSTERILLDVEDLKVWYRAGKETVYAVNGVSFRLKEGRTLGLVGESGAGKTSAVLSMIRLLPYPGQFGCSRMTICGKDVPAMSRRQLTQFRGSEVSMIFQDPLSALNPVFPVGEQIADALRLHTAATRYEAWQRAEELLAKVGIPAGRASDYPHAFSGGMRQRVAIAIAIACSPKLLIADEPTTALDVTIQAQILEMLNQIRAKSGMSMILITHDLGVAAMNCDEVAVMYAGRIVEYGPVAEVFRQKAHPYTEGLFHSLPDIQNKVKRLRPIPGEMPDPTHLPQGCAFAPRCRYARESCFLACPALREVQKGHFAACTLDLPSRVM